jgi:hypothetical protein
LLGPDKGGYYHELFLRGKQFLSTYIYRIKIKGKGPRKASSAKDFPEFYAFPFLPSTTTTTNNNNLPLQRAAPVTRISQPSSSCPDMNQQLELFSLVNLLRPQERMMDLGVLPSSFGEQQQQQQRNAILGQSPLPTFNFQGQSAASSNLSAHLPNTNTAWPVGTILDEAALALLPK